MGRFNTWKHMLSIEGPEVEFRANGLLKITDNDQYVLLGESEVRELMIQIIQNRIVSGQNNYGS